MSLTPKQVILLRFAIVLVALVPLVWWNPGGFVPDGLRDNLVAEFVGALITLVFVERAIDAVERKTQRTQLDELRRAVLGTLEADLHALLSLLVAEPAPRDDPLRRASQKERLDRFLGDLASDAFWADAPSGHAAAVRGRIRDLGEDADRLMVWAERVDDEGTRARLDALRVACRDLDEEWSRTARGALAKTWREKVAPEAGALAGDDRD